MNVDQGKLSFAASIDNANLQRDALESRNILRGISETAVKEGSRMESAFASVAKAATGIFAVGQLKEFVKSIINVRSEIESLEISFRTLLGNKQKADQLFSQIREFAVNTPMQLKDLASGAQMLLSFNYEADKVMGTLKALGDISMGDSQKFQSLTLAFSQMSSTGKLMGQDLLQMINAGFNPLVIMSEQTGKSIAKLKDEMSQGAISSEMVEKAFLAASSAGGQFYGMLEAQSKSIQGAFSNLQGAFDDMLNDMGTSAQSGITDIIGGATTILKHYQEIGEVLLGLVGTYGVYKTAVLATEAVRKSVTAIKHTEEAAQLSLLLNTEQKARISKLELATTSEAYREAVLAEMQAELQRQVSITQSSQIELTAARERLAMAESAKASAIENVSLKRAELAAVIEEATAERNASIAKQITLESEKQSRAALLVVKLEEQRASLINQAKTLKEAGAERESITAINKKIAAISQKLAAAKAEEIQCSRNIVALRKEATAELDAANTKKIAIAQTNLETAQEELNTAAKSRNTAAREVSSKATAVNTAAKRANAIETAIDTAAENANATATGMLARAKNVASAAAAKLNAVIMANPWAVATAAVIALGYAMYKLVTYQDDATKSKKRLEKAVSEFNMEVDSEQAKISLLFTKLKAAKKGTQEYKDIKDAILGQYGQYLSNLSKEKSSLEDVAGAYMAVCKAARAAAQARAMDAYMKTEGDKFGEKATKIKSDLKKLLDKKYGDKKGKDGMPLSETLYWQIVGAWEGNGTKLSDKFAQKFAGTGDLGHNALIDLNTRYNVAKGQFEKQIKEAELLFGSAPESKVEKAPEEIYAEGLKSARKREAEAKEKLNALLKDATRAKTKEVADARAELAAVQKELNDTYGVDLKAEKRASDTAAKSSAKAAKDANNNKVKLAERKAKIEQEKQAIIDTYNQTELDIEQARIDAMEDGYDKQVRQVELDYKRETERIEEYTRKLVEKLRDLKEREWEAANPNAKDKGETFDRESITQADLSEAQIEQIEEMQELALDARRKGWKKTADLEHQNWLDYLKTWGTYEEKRLAIVLEYEKKIEDARKNGTKVDAQNLEKEKEAKLIQLESDNLANNIDWGATFGKLGTVLQQAALQTLDKIEAYMKTPEFKALNASNKKAYYDLRSKLYEETGGNMSNPFSRDVWKDISAKEESYQKAVDELLDATAKHKEAVDAVIEASKLLEEATTEQARDEAQKQLNEAQKRVEDTGTVKTEAESNLVTAQNDLAHSANSAEAGLNALTDAIKDLNSGSLSGIFNGVLKLIKAIQEFKKQFNFEKPFKDFKDSTVSLGDESEKTAKSVKKVRIGMDGFSDSIGDSKVFPQMGKDVSATSDAISELGDISEIAGEGVERAGDAIAAAGEAFVDSGALDGLAKAGAAAGGVSASLEGLQGASQELGNVTSEVGGQLGGIGGAIGGIIGAVLSLLDVLREDPAGFLQDLWDKIFKAIEANMKISVNGKAFEASLAPVARGIGNVLSSAIKATTLGLIDFKKWFHVNGNAQRIIEAQEKLAKRNEYLQYAVENLTETIEKGQGSKSVEAYQDALEVQQEIEDNLLEIARLQSIYTGAHHSWAHDFGDFSEEDIERITEKIGREFNGDLFSLTADEMKQVRDLLPDIWEDITTTGSYGERLQEKLDEYIEQAGIAESLKDSLNEALTQISFDNMYDNFIETLMDMETTAEDVAENISEMFMRAALANYIGKEFTDELENWYNSFSEAVADDDFTEQEQGYLADWYQDMIDRAAQRRDELAKITGYDETYSDREGSSKGIATASQDSVDELNGRATAIQSHTYSICENTKLLVSNTSSILNSVRVIEQNTGAINSRMESMEKDLRQVRNTVDDIELRGIKIV